MPITRSARMVVYSALRRKLKRPHIKIVKLLEGNPDAKIWEMEFPTKDLSQVCFDYDGMGKEYNLSEALSNPKSKITIWFEGGKKQCGLEPLKWYLMVNNRIFKRLTHRDVGNENAKCGLQAIRDKRAIIYLSPLKINKQDKEMITNSISQHLCKEKDGDRRI